MIHQGISAEELVKIIQNLQLEKQQFAPASVDELVEQVRSCIHDDIQRLHGTMPLWGVDYAVERYLERCWRLSAGEVQAGAGCGAIAGAAGWVG